MFLGGSLLPDYYTEKINLFVAMGPAANLKHVEVPLFEKLAPFWWELQLLVLEVGAYDTANAGWWTE